MQRVSKAFTPVSIKNLTGHQRGRRDLLSLPRFTSSSASSVVVAEQHREIALPDVSREHRGRWIPAARRKRGPRALIVAGARLQIPEHFAKVFACRGFYVVVERIRRERRHRECVDEQKLNRAKRLV